MKHENYQYYRSLSDRTDDELESIYLRAHRLLSLMADLAQGAAVVEIAAEAMTGILNEPSADIQAAILGRPEGAIYESQYITWGMSV